MRLVKFGSFVKLWLYDGLCGFTNVPNAGWQRNLKKCEAGAFRLLSLSV